VDASRGDRAVMLNTNFVHIAMPPSSAKCEVWMYDVVIESIMADPNTKMFIQKRGADE
jgi:hypothetical protein